MRLSSRALLHILPVILLLTTGFSWQNCFRPFEKLFSGNTRQHQTQSIRNYSDLEHFLSPYFLMGDPKGWQNQLAKASSSVYLSGNGGGAERVTLPDGSRVIVKTFHLGRNEINNAPAIVNQMKAWEATGEGVPLRGVSTSYNPKSKQTALRVLMEDLEAPENSVGITRQSGNGTELSSLRRYSPESKRWMVQRLVQTLDKHPDPHPKNIQYRVTQLSPFGKLPPAGSYYREGDLIFQVLLIDVTGGEAMGDHPMRSGNPEYVPSLLLQYNRSWQEKFFNQQLGLSSSH